jgi:hypothetical protein
MKRSSLSVCILVLGLSLCVFGQVRAPARPASHASVVKAMPDFCQLEQRFGRLPGGGSQYCAPVAVSNALVWFHEHGFPNLAPVRQCTPRIQFEVIKNLGSKRYMQTDMETGTSPLETMQGLERYVQDRGYDITIEWKGWREGGKFASADPIPNPDWLVKNSRGSSNVVVSVGWYTYHRKKKMYERLGGHYVTLVGVETKDKKHPVMYIHNPSFGTEPGKKPKPEVCRLVPITEGNFAPWCEYHHQSAKGYFRIEGIRMRDDADFAILDGAIGFSISLRRENEYIAADTDDNDPEKDL